MEVSEQMTINVTKKISPLNLFNLSQHTHTRARALKHTYIYIYIYIYIKHLFSVWETHYLNSTSVTPEMYNPLTIKAEMLTPQQLSCFGWLLDNGLWGRRVLYESHKRRAIKTMGCRIVDVKQGGWINRRVNDALHQMLSRENS